MSATAGSVYQTMVPEHGVSDPHVMPTKSVQQMTQDVLYSPGRAILLDVTGTGTTSYELLDGSVLVLNVQAGQIYEFNDSVVKLLAGSATLVAWIKY